MNFEGSFPLCVRDQRCSRDHITVHFGPPSFPGEFGFLPSCGLISASHRQVRAAPSTSRISNGHQLELKWSQKEGTRIGPRSRL